MVTRVFFPVQVNWFCPCFGSSSRILSLPLSLGSFSSRSSKTARLPFCDQLSSTSRTWSRARRGRMGRRGEPAMSFFLPCSNEEDEKSESLLLRSRRSSTPPPGRIEESSHFFLSPPSATRRGDSLSLSFPFKRLFFHARQCVAPSWPPSRPEQEARRPAPLRRRRWHQNRLFARPRPPFLLQAFFLLGLFSLPPAPHKQQQQQEREQRRAPRLGSSEEEDQEVEQQQDRREQQQQQQQRQRRDPSPLPPLLPPLRLLLPSPLPVAASSPSTPAARPRPRAPPLPLLSAPLPPQQQPWRAPRRPASLPYRFLGGARKGQERRRRSAASSPTSPVPPSSPPWESPRAASSRRPSSSESGTAAAFG